MQQPLKISDHLTPFALQQIQDGFANVTGLEVLIFDPEGNQLAEPTNGKRVRERHEALMRSFADRPQNQKVAVPIHIADQLVGRIVLTGNSFCEFLDNNTNKLLIPGMPTPDCQDANQDLNNKTFPHSASVVSLLYLLADIIGRLCEQGQAMSIQLMEMQTLYRISTLMSGKRDLDNVLQTLAREITLTMQAKACTIKLLNKDTRMLESLGAYGLSDAYLSNKEALSPENYGQIDIAAMKGDVVYVEDMKTDPRVLDPQEGVREGLTSVLSAGMLYRGQTIGVIRVYTEETRKFTETQCNLLKALGQLAAGAIWNVELDQIRRRTEHIERQVKLAVDVQRTLLPTDFPNYESIGVAGRYEPSYELSGDFYDFIPLESSLGIIVGDVVGKGVAAALMMASVRASLRAHIEDVYDIDDVMARVNNAMCRDTHDYQFATVFYCTIDTKTLRMTYASAGHDPGFLIRNNKIIELNSTGLPLGIIQDSDYEKVIIDLKPEDRILLYSDGAPDAANFEGEQYGRKRLKESALRHANLNARQLAGNIHWDINRFIGLNHRADDTTLVTVRVY